MWTHKLEEDPNGGGKLTVLNPKKIYDKDAVIEWLRAAVSTARGEQPYLPAKYGLEMVLITTGDDPVYYLEQSIKEICSLRNDISLRSCNCRLSDDRRSIYATVTCRTSYDSEDFTINTKNIRLIRG